MGAGGLPKSGSDAGGIFYYRAMKLFVVMLIKVEERLIKVNPRKAE